MSNQEYKNLNMVCLYIFTHNITGLKYFGKTINSFTKKDLLRYGGSGVYWNHHLNIHGKNLSVEIYGIYKISEVKEIALKFSKDNDIVKAVNESGERKGKKVWANIEPEDGLSGFTKRTSGRVCAYNIEKGSYEQVSVDELKYNPNLEATTKNQVTIFDTILSKYRNISKEEYAKGQYMIHSKGYVNCLDVSTGLTQKVTKEEFDNNSNLQNSMKGLIPCWDTRTNTKVNLSRQELNKEDYYISNTEKVGSVVYFDIVTGESGTCNKKEFASNHNYMSKVSKNYYEIYNNSGILQESIYRIDLAIIPDWLFNGLRGAMRRNKVYASRITNTKNKQYKYKGWYMKQIKIKDEFWMK